MTGAPTNVYTFGEKSVDIIMELIVTPTQIPIVISLRPASPILMDSFALTRPFTPSPRPPVRCAAYTRAGAASRPVS